MVRWLVQHHADVCICDKNGWTPLFFAFQGRNLSIAKVLIIGVVWCY